MKRKDRSSTEALNESFTRREREILGLLSEGYSGPEIAAKLTLALSSVKWYIQQIYGKLGVNSKRQALTCAEELGLLQPHRPVPLGSLPPTDSVQAPDHHLGRLPTGTVTFLFTDIEGSTPLWEKMPQAMKLAVDRHHAILRQAIESNQGVVFKIIGDAFQASFPLAAQALAAAIKAQHQLLVDSWGDTGPLRVRMGLHTGPAELDESGDYAVSHTLNRVARVMSSGHGGQVLLSLTTCELLRDHFSPEVFVRDLGEHRLKGLLHPEHIFQIEVPGLQEDFPPLKSETFPQHNLPLQLSSFIGRQSDVAQVCNLAKASRLVTLVGIGGVGKTRLELKVAEELLGEFSDGVWLVSLASQTDPQLVPQDVGNVFGLREQTGIPIQVELVNHLQTKHLLLVLDNCEHLVAACADLTDLILRSCPEIHILASSREALAVEGEAVYQVASLSVPEHGQINAAEILAQFDSVQLFAERAGAGTHIFNLTEENALFVTQICQQLDGIPLAIELAAARVKVLGVAQIASRLDDSFRVLGGGSRTAQPRHQTLRAAIDWSFELLSVPERLLFRRLSVFIGGWTMEAAENVCSDEQLSEQDILDFLSLLVTKSLVVVEQNDRGLNRYHFLETMRQYAKEKLVQAGELGPVRRKHFTYFLETAEYNDAELQGGRPLRAFVWLAVEHANLLAALEWASTGDPPHNPAGFQRLSLLMHQDFHGWGTHMLKKKASEEQN